MNLFSLNEKHIKSINADLVHLYNKGTGVRVGIIGGGIAPHVSFSSRLKGGWDFVANAVSSKQDPWGDGTAAAGIIGASGRPFSADKGLLGVAPEAWLYDLMVVDSTGLFTAQRVADAINWAISTGIQILLFNVSWPDSWNPPQSLKDAITSASSAGILMVAPVGEFARFLSPGGTKTIAPKETGLYPANQSSVIAVGFVNILDTVTLSSQEEKRLHGYVYRSGIVEKWSTFYLWDYWDPMWPWSNVYLMFSKRSDNLEIVAPGGYHGVEVTQGTDGVTQSVGTTQKAAAYIAGILALGLASGATPAVVRTRLQQGAIDIGTSGWPLQEIIVPSDWSGAGWDNAYGYGLPNALLVAPPESLKDKSISDQKTDLGITAPGQADSTKVQAQASITPRGIPRDDVPFIVRYPWPGDGETLIPLNAPIRFKVKSEKAGVDIYSVKVRLNGTEYKLGDGAFSFKGTPADYEITVQPPTPWTYEQLVNLEIEAGDLKGNPGVILERI